MLSLPDLPQTLNTFGITDKRLHCPTCDPTKAKRPTLKIYNRSFGCFRCGDSGGILDCLSLLGLKAPREFREPQLELLPIWRVYQQQHSSAHEWARSRGYPQSFEANWGFAAAHNPLQKAGFDLKTIEQAGLLAGGNNELFQNRVVFPVQNLKGTIIGFQARATIDDNVKWLASKPNAFGSIDRYMFGLANLNLETDVPLFLAEGITDTLALQALGLDAIGSFGIQALPLEILCKVKRPIVAVYDNDRQDLSVGNNYKSWEHVLPQLAALKRQRPDIYIKCWKLPTIAGVKDTFELFQFYNWDVSCIYAHFKDRCYAIEDLAIETISDLKPLLNCLAGFSLSAPSQAYLDRRVVQAGGWLKVIEENFL
jgi:DNA primase catalytic core, N-terminal domain